MDNLYSRSRLGPDDFSLPGDSALSILLLNDENPPSLERTELRVNDGVSVSLLSRSAMAGEVARRVQKVCELKKQRAEEEAGGQCRSEVRQTRDQASAVGLGVAIPTSCREGIIELLLDMHAT